MFHPEFKKSILNILNWSELARNPNAIHLMARLDTEKMRSNCRVFAEELTAYVFHPTRLMRICDSYGLDVVDYFEMV